MASSEKPIVHHNQQQQQQRQQQVLIKCPRCNSLNTKFCYYNNYSLSQPRHFCKSCKRYWTRGGTLRNVPIGGGCRKKKRIKRGFTAVDDHTPNPNPNLDLDLDHSTPLYELLQRNPKYPRFNHRVSDHASSYDLVQPQMSSLGLGFSSSDHNSAPLVSNNPSMFSGGLITSICNSDHNISSLLASNIQQQPTSFLGFVPYADGGGSVVNNVPMEEQKNSMGWNTNGQNINNDHIFKGLESSDPTSFIWNITGGEGGAWHDPTSNVSVPSI